MTKRVSGGYALPSVLISSIIMLIVLISSVTSTVAVRISLKNQYYDKLSHQASEAGIAYAKACISANNGTPQWTDSKQLKPYTDCYGNKLSTASACSDSSRDTACSLNIVDDNVLVSFSVPTPLPDSTGTFTNISANGTITMLRTSDSSVWRQFGYQAKTINYLVKNSSTLSLKQPENGYWKQLSSGNYHSCGIASNNNAYCWGLNTNGQLGNNSTAQSKIPTAITMSGELSGLTIKSISVGDSHTCAITSNNQAYCWGLNTNGQLGNGSTTQNLTPVAVTRTGSLSGLTLRQISTGNSHTCAIASNNQIYCWGNNASGQLGNNSTAQSTSPVAVDISGALNGLDVKSISVSNNFSCATTSNDKAYCWGLNTNGQLGNNSTTQSNVPVQIYTSGALSGLTVSAIATGGSHTCVIASNKLAYCWGLNANGQLGNNSTTQSSVPVAVYTTSGPLSSLNVRSISAGASFSCAIASNSSGTNSQAYCWGLAINGQLGNNSTTQSNIPVNVTTSGLTNGLTAKAITGSGNSTCIIASDNQSYCWGLGSNGQLGNNLTVQSLVPVATDTLALNDLTTQTITAGNAHSCMIASNSQAYCWGLNANGQLGNSSTTQSTTPAAVYTSGILSGLTIKTISSSNTHTCVVASNNQAYCWGLNTNGQLGNNSTAQSTVPVAVYNSGALSGLTIKTISVGDSHTCVIASNNQAYCWGLNTNGQLGNSSTTQSLVPVAVTTSGPLSGLYIKSIDASSSHSCAVASDNNAYCWGNNASGQLGNNSTNQSTAPTPVTTSGALSGLFVKSISLGNNHSCVIASNNRAYCWGDNTNGQLGNNSTTQNLTPASVYTSGSLNGLFVNSIYSGANHTCIIASNNNAYCWGLNANGQLGNNSTTQSIVPAAVTTSGSLNGLTVKSVTAGYSHTCIIASDYKLYCWGNNTNGQLGNNSTIQSLVPVATSTITDSESRKITSSY